MRILNSILNRVENFPVNDISDMIMTGVVNEGENTFANLLALQTVTGKRLEGLLGR